MASLPRRSGPFLGVLGTNENVFVDNVFKKIFWEINVFLLIFSFLIGE